MDLVLDLEKVSAKHKEAKAEETAGKPLDKQLALAQADSRKDEGALRQAEERLEAALQALRDAQTEVDNVSDTVGRRREKACASAARIVECQRALDEEAGGGAPGPAGGPDRGRQHLGHGRPQAREGLRLSRQARGVPAGARRGVRRGHAG